MKAPLEVPLSAIPEMFKQTQAQANRPLLDKLIALACEAWIVSVFAAGVLGWLVGRSY